jgi:UDP-N-acetylglucosamine 3-dehydrogenase
MAIKPIGIGIVGTGFMGRAFAQICTQLPDAKLVGLCDVVDESVRGIADQYKVPAFSKYSDLIRSPEVEAIVVSTPEDVHVAPCVEALQSGKHVLVEKPIADTVADSQTVLAATRPDLVLLVGHVLRFTTAYALAKQAVDEGKVGTVQNIYTRRLNGKSAQGRLKGRCSLPMFLGVHDYDVVHWLADSRPVRVYAQSQATVLEGMGFHTEDTNWAMINFENGVLAVCETGWILPPGHPSGSDSRLAVQGSDGRVDLQLLQQGITLSTPERATYTGTVFMPRVDGEIRAGFVSELQHFLACIRGERTLRVTPDDAVVAVQIAEAVLESAQTGQPVELGRI